MKSSIGELKAEVRDKIAKGRPLTVMPKTPRKTGLEAREIQMKIADLEQRVAAVAEGQPPHEAGTSERRLKLQIENLRKRLK
ncbi:MAG: hypothetical protein ACT4N2_01420 [Hyphomicrobium sp.]